MNRFSLLSAIVGGLVAVAVGAILIATGALKSTETKTVVEQAPLGQTKPAASSSGGGKSVSAIYKATGPGVAFIQAQIVEQTSNPFGFPQQQKGEATGSGFVLDDNGDIATNAHVVDGASKVQVSFGNGNPVPATIVGKDVSTDLAVIKVDPSKVKLHKLDLGNSDQIQVGDPVVAIGNPFGYSDTVTTGIVSALQREIQAPNNFSIEHAIQTDAAINPGNSGGPLLNAQGQVIGINSQIATSGGNKGSVGIGFAIPVNLAKQVFPQLEKNGKVAHAFIGVTTTDVTKQIADAFNLPVDHGAMVQQVSKGSPADKAGLRAGHIQTSAGIVAGGDVIVGVAGKAVNKAADIASAISDKKPGDQIPIAFYRGKTKKLVTLTLGNRPAKAPSTQQGQGGGGGGGGLFPLP